MSSFLSTIFIAFIIIGVLSITSALPVMLSIRDMFYRHKAAGMLGYSSVGRALATAEKRFIIIASVLFCLVFLPVSGILEGGGGGESCFDSCFNLTRVRLLWFNDPAVQTSSSEKGRGPIICILGLLYLQHGHIFVLR